MKTRLFTLFGVAAFGLTLAAGSASACPVGQGDDIRPRRPVAPVVNNVSLQASELFERASRLETAAASREESARSREMQADTLANRARMIRNQAVLVGFSDRENMMAVAEELVIRAADMRSRAAEDRAQASELRMQARTLRERAVQLVRLQNGGNGNGGGWRNKRAVRDFAPPPPSRPTSDGTTVL